MSWHQRTIVVVTTISNARISSTRTQTPATSCRCGSIAQTRGGGSSSSNSVHVRNIYLDIIWGIIVFITVVILVDGAVERGQIAKCLGVVSVRGWTSTTSRFWLPFGWVKICFVGMIVCGYSHRRSVCEGSYPGRCSGLEYRSRGGRCLAGRSGGRHDVGGGQGFAAVLLFTLLRAVQNGTAWGSNQSFTVRT